MEKKSKTKQSPESVDLGAMSRDDLAARCRGLGEELMRLRFRKSSGQLDKSHLVGLTRRDLARSLTALRSRFPRSANKSA